MIRYRSSHPWLNHVINSPVFVDNLYLDMAATSPNSQYSVLSQPPLDIDSSKRRKEQTEGRIINNAPFSFLIIIMSVFATHFSFCSLAGHVVHAHPIQCCVIFCCQQASANTRTSITSPFSDVWLDSSSVKMLSAEYHKRHCDERIGKGDDIESWWRRE